MTTPVRTGGRTQQGRGPAPDPVAKGNIRPATRTSRPSPRPSAASSSPAAGPGRSTPARTQRRQTGTAAARRARAAVPSMTDYQKIIAAEFVLAELLIALTPMTSRKQPTDISPYAPRDMTKMLAVGVVFFLLELVAIPAGWGRGAAWFGAIILLTVGLNEAANVVNDIDALAGIRDVGSKVKAKVSNG